jgi:hypothetical protein
MCFQAPKLAAQAVLPTKDVPVGASLMFFTQLLGASVFVSVGQNVLDNQLLQKLSGIIPGFDPSLVTSSGATSQLDSVPASLRPTVLTAYNGALRTVFQIGLAMSCLTILGSAALEWKSVKKEQAGEKAEAEREKSGEAGRVVSVD